MSDGGFVFVSAFL